MPGLEAQGHTSEGQERSTPPAPAWALGSGLSLHCSTSEERGSPWAMGPSQGGSASRHALGLSLGRLGEPPSFSGPTVVLTALSSAPLLLVPAHPGRKGEPQAPAEAPSFSPRLPGFTPSSAPHQLRDQGQVALFLVAPVPSTSHEVTRATLPTLRIVLRGY